MNILLLGGNGRCGSLVHAALIAQGMHVRAPGSAELDLTRMHDAAAWTPWLDGADALIHTAGVLREAGSDTFAAHLRAMRSLAEAISAQRAARGAAGGAAHGEAGSNAEGKSSGVRHLVLLSAAGANAASAVPWFAAKGEVENCLLAPGAMKEGALIAMPAVTIVRAGALYLDAAGSPRRFHPQALTLDWRRATGCLPLTPMMEAVRALVRAASGAAPHRNALIDLAAPPLARAA